MQRQLEYDSEIHTTLGKVLKNSELVHGDDPERCYGEGGGRGVHVWERK